MGIHLENLAILCQIVDVNQDAFSVTISNIFLQWIQTIYTVAPQLGPLNFHHLVFVTSNIQIIMRTITRKEKSRKTAVFRICIHCDRKKRKKKKKKISPSFFFKKKKKKKKK